MSYYEYPSGTGNVPEYDNNFSNRRSILVEPNHNYPPNNHVHYDINQPQYAHYAHEKENVEFQHDVESPRKHKNQKNQIITKSPVKWYRNTRAVLQMFKSNFLLVFLPPAIIMKRFGVNESILFFFNFLAIVPMAKILSVGINDLSARLHPVRKNSFFNLLFQPFKIQVSWLYYKFFFISSFL